MTVVEDLNLHVLEVPSRRGPGRAAAARYLGGALWRRSDRVEVFGPDLVSCARHAKVKQLYHLAAEAVQGHGGEAGEGRFQRVPSEPRISLVPH